MLSVLIPTYNYNSFNLVKELHEQLSKLNTVFEIVCIDDGSKSRLNEFNQEINSLTHCSFSELKENIGRSSIRNLLSKKAKYNWLLFLDADVMPVNKNFISKYLSKCILSKNVFCGGLKYIRSKENSNLLRYKYGVNYEEVGLKKRSNYPYKYFFTSNFLISRDVFNEIQFEEKLRKYGREDLLFSLNLKSKGFKIIHIKNEVYHLGIDDDMTFVSKTKQAMENVAFLDNEKLLFKEDSKSGLLRIVSLLKVVGISKTIGRLNHFFEKKAIKNSSLFYLNCLKVSYLCSLKEKL